MQHTHENVAQDPHVHAHGLDADKALALLFNHIVVRRQDVGLRPDDELQICRVREVVFAKLSAESKP